MNGLLVAGLILGIGAPAPKEVPKKDPPSIVGLWETKKWTGYGNELPNKPTLFEFTADGQFNMTQIGRAGTGQHKYKLDVSKNPAEIDWLVTGDKESILKGIYTIDGDTLVFCIEDGYGLNRPTKFESAKGSKTMMWTLKRVEKNKE